MFYGCKIVGDFLKYSLRSYKNLSERRRASIEEGLSESKRVIRLGPYEKRLFLSEIY